MTNTKTDYKALLEIEPVVPDPEGVEFDPMTPEEEERFLRELLEENAEVLRGLAQR
jgi:hypothetical protein